LNYISEDLKYKSNGVYVGKHDYDLVWITTGSQSTYYVDVQYTDGNPLMPQRFSVSSLPVLPSGMVPHIRGVDSCQWP
jgi:hypothetical protein